MLVDFSLCYGNICKVHHVIAILLASHVEDLCHIYDNVPPQYLRQSPQLFRLYLALKSLIFMVIKSAIKILEKST